MNRRPWSRLLRLYPPQWRERYEEEFATLLGDCFSDGLNARALWSIALGGLKQRARYSPLGTRSTSAGQRLRDAEVVMLYAWGLVVVAGLLFAKFSEHWSSTTPRLADSTPLLGYRLVVVGAGAGALLLAGAGVVALPDLTRWLRQGGRRTIAGPLLRASVTLALAALATLLLTWWAHHLSSQQRNGSSALYGVAFVCWATVIAGSIFSTVGSLAAIGRRMSWAARSLRRFAAVAIGLAAASVVVTAGIASWWIGESSVASTQLAGSMRASVNPALPVSFPVVLDIAGSLLALALVLALVSSVRIVRGLALVR